MAVVMFVPIYCCTQVFIDPGECTGPSVVLRIATFRSSSGHKAGLII